MVVTRLYFGIPAQTSTTHYEIDLALELSKHHRRLIRQKQLFTVYGGLYQDQNGSNAYISTAPHYWVTKRSINRGFKAWKKQISEAMSNVADSGSSPVRSGKWSDFKIRLAPHGDDDFDGYLHARDAANNLLPSGEWNYTTVTRPRPDIEAGTDQYVSQDSDQFEMHICGPHESTTQGTKINYSRVGLIKSWLDSRSIPESLPADGSTGNPENIPEQLNDPLYQMFLKGDADEDEKIVDAINTENDFPPYDTDLVWGNNTDSDNSRANLQLQCIASPDDSSAGVATVAGFQSLCGLLRVTITGDNGSGESDASVLILDVESNGVAF